MDPVPEIKSEELLRTRFRQVAFCVRVLNRIPAKEDFVLSPPASATGEFRSQ